MSFIQQFISDTMDYQKRYKIQSTLVWAGTFLVAAPFLLLNEPGQRPTALLSWPLAACAMAAVVVHKLRRYEQRLLQRIFAEDGGPSWLVHINGVPVGHVTDAVLAGIQHEIFADGQVWLKQAEALIGYLPRTVWYMAKLIPVLGFWLVIGAYFIWHDVVSDIAATITAQQFIAAIPTFMVALGTLAVVSMALQMAFGTQVNGLTNEFERECVAGVRRALSCAAEGHVSLYLVKIDPCEPQFAGSAT